MITTCFFHAGGFGSFFQLLTYPLSIVFNHGPDIDEGDTCELIYQEIDAFKPSWLIFGSHHLVLMSTQKPKDKNLDLSSILVVSPMGSTVPQTLYQDLKTFFPSLVFVFQHFGLTEMGQAALVTLDVTQLGFVAPDIEVKIVDPETGEILGPHQTGELLIKTLAPMKGYLNRPEETKEFFAGDGYIHTGDLASYAENGLFKYEGRLKELIKYKNYHLYPLEIEKVICKHQDVVEAAVFGRPEPTVQELVTAVVIKTPNSNLSEQEITELVNKNVDDSKRLRGGVIFVDKLPKNPVGKIQRKKLFEFYQQQK